MLNKNIKIDLHIHSQASFKKDGEIVNDSNISNLNVLFDKLNEFEISLISITDHNVFDSKLYLEIDKMIKNNKYEYPKNIIPGIEFNVDFDEISNSKGGQLNVYFDSKSEEDLLKIERIISSEKYQKKIDENFSKKELEELLKEIGLSVILVSSQTKGLSFKSNSGNNKALSDHTNDPYKYFYNGYISALEFQKPRVEGILKNDFFIKKIENISLIAFSDCHDWKHYPYHDKSQKKDKDLESKFFTTIKSLPTFLGLLMSFSSPETRLNRLDMNHKNYISSIKIRDKEIKLDKSVNVIIGNNGSGKSMLFSILSENLNLLRPYKKIQKDNNIELLDENKNKTKKIIEQNKIIEKHFNHEELFNEEIKFSENDDDFKNFIDKKANEIYSFIDNNIELNKNEKLVKDISFELMSNNNIVKYYLNFKKDISPIDTKEIEKIKSKLKGIIEDLKFLYETVDVSFKKIIKSTKEEMEKILKFYSAKHEKIKKSNLLISKIETLITNYESQISKKITTQEQKQKQYEKIKKNLIDNFKKYFSCLIKKIKIFEWDDISENNFNDSVEEVQKNGYIFKSIPKYITSIENINSKNLINHIFKEKIQNIDDLYNIKTDEFFKENLKLRAINVKKEMSNKDIYFQHVENYIKEMIYRDKTILTIENYNKMGSTPGEMATAYINFTIINEEYNNSIIMLDQPEDNISNINISNEIIKKINSFRDQKQFIIVTHNPILVVNLDADNVIYLEKEVNKDEIKFNYGCLEYKEQNYSTLENIIKNMEGGILAIERRLKIYGTTRKNED